MFHLWVVPTDGLYWKVDESCSKIEHVSWQCEFSGKWSHENSKSVSWKTFRVSSCKIMLINFWFWMNRKQSVCIPHANGGAKNGWGKSLVKQEYFYVYIFSTARCLFTMRRKNIFSQSKTEQMKWIQGGLWGCNMIISNFSYRSGIYFQEFVNKPRIWTLVKTCDEIAERLSTSIIFRLRKSNIFSSETSCGNLIFTREACKRHSMLLNRSWMCSTNFETRIMPSANIWLHNSSTIYLLQLVKMIFSSEKIKWKMKIGCHRQPRAGWE